MADLLESSVDILNGIGLQTGISKQIEELQKINKDLKIYMHSQGHYVIKQGAENTKNNHNYFSYGAPMTVNSVKETFVNDAGKPPEDIQKNEGDYVANPQNILNPTTWRKPGHGTDNYGASKLEKKESE